jgi:hypothetical protein
MDPKKKVGLATKFLSNRNYLGKSRLKAKGPTSSILASGFMTSMLRKLSEVAIA